jgi:hypothetical protein
MVERVGRGLPVLERLRRGRGGKRERENRSRKRESFDQLRAPQDS